MPKLKPVIVVSVPPVVGKFGRSDILRVGASKLNAAAIVPTTDATVTKTSSATPAPGALRQANDVADVQEVVSIAISRSCEVDVMSELRRFMPETVTYEPLDDGAFTVERLVVVGVSKVKVLINVPT
jgi:hypothetical protein